MPPRKRGRPQQKTGQAVKPYDRPATVTDELVQLSTDEAEAGNVFQQLLNADDAITVNSDFFVAPSVVRCADDDIALHVSGEMCAKIWKGEFIHLAQLLRKEPSSGRGSNLTINESGQIEVMPKTTRQIYSIKEWTDAFLIFMYIYIKKFPSKAGELLQYIATIREAEGRGGASSGWKTYDENFRMRQAVAPMPWGKIHSDLWLKTVACMSQPSVMAVKNTTVSSQNTLGRPKNVCYDFNSPRGCRFANCKYAHKCLICKGDHNQSKCNNQRMLPFRKQ